MPLSEHVYCVAITIKMTEQVQQWIYIRFCIKLEHSSTETIPMIQKATAMGNWWLAVLSRNVPTRPFVHHVLCSFLAKYQITEMTQTLYSPDLVPCDFWLFPKSPLKEKRFQTISEIQENRMGQLMATGRTMWGPKVPTLKGTEASLSFVQCFLHLLQ